MPVACCTAGVYPFVNVSSVDIPWTGETPNVQVYYQDGGDYRLSDDMNQVTLEAGLIKVDLGGPATGLVKVF